VFVILFSVCSMRCCLCVVLLVESTLLCRSAYAEEQCRLLTSL
jgi:hypothetical protein